MDPLNVYDQYFEAECEFNGTMRHAAQVMLIATSQSGRIKYEVGVNFFPHEDPEDFRISYDAYQSLEVYEAAGRRSKKREEVFMQSLRENADALASEMGGKIFWDRPLNEARRA
jgi:hypothetical protein